MTPQANRLGKYLHGRFNWRRRETPRRKTHFLGMNVSFKGLFARPGSCKKGAIAKET